MITAWVVNYFIFFLMLVITGLTLLGGLASLVHAASTRPDAFSAIDARSKGFWIGVTAVSTAVAAIFGVLSTLVRGVLGASGVLTSFSGLFLIAAIVGISVYLADIRPRLDDIQGKSWFRKAA